MHKVPLLIAIIFEVILIFCHDYFEQPEIWYVIGINGIFIIYSIFQIIYELGFITIDLDWLFDIDDLRSVIFFIALIAVVIWIFLCFIGVLEFPQSIG